MERGMASGSSHMPLHAALEKLKEWRLTAGQVRRVAVERQGVIHIEIHQAEKQRFFVYEANELRELQPENDPKIPLVSEMHQGGFASDHMIISYRPGRRIVLGPASGEHGTIIKAYKKHRVAQAAARYAVAISACEQAGFDVPELLQYEAGMECLVLAKRSGQVPFIAEDAVDVWFGIGSCLRSFQQSHDQSHNTDSLQEFNHRDELDVLGERARRYLMCMPALPGCWQPGFKRLEEAAENLPPTVKGLAHRDLHDRQFIVSGRMISLLDFDLICIADVALDAGNLLAHLKLRALQQGQESGSSAVPVCSEAFLDGLGRQDTPGFESHLLFYQATTFYRLALLYALRPRWAHLTATLIDEGKRCIDAIDELRANP